ncbi:MAG: hypothetical protein VX519_07385 [Myxococcota bacterium]|nr:hypothetical protein [Myxococcota bacterium]
MTGPLLVLLLASPPSAAQEANTTPPKTTQAENTLSDEHADWVHRHLAPAATFRGQERRDFLGALLTEDLDPALSAAVHRALKVAEDDEASFGAVVRRAVRPNGISIHPARKPKKPRANAPGGQAKAMRDYRARHLRVKSETHRERGDTVVVSNPGPYRGWSTTVIQQPDSVEYSWAVYQDFIRLNVPDFLEIAGQAENALAIREEIQLLETKARKGAIAGFTGLAMTLGGMIALSSDPQNQPANWTTLSGVLVMTGGFLGAGIPRAKAHRLQYNYPATLTPQATRSLVDTHNEKLQQELRLPIHDAIMLESGHRERNH